MASYEEVGIQVDNALRQLSIDTKGLTGEALRAELTAFIGRQSVAAEGKVTMLWACRTADGIVGYGDVADAIAEADDPNIRTLNKTVANRVLANDAFMDLVATSYGFNAKEFREAAWESEMGLKKKAFLFDGKNGLWAQISKRFAQETTGELRIMTSNPSCLLYTSPSPRDRTRSRMPSSA